jgi:hypothetical protein
MGFVSAGAGTFVGGDGVAAGTSLESGVDATGAGFSLLEQLTARRATVNSTWIVFIA